MVGVRDPPRDLRARPSGAANLPYTCAGMVCSPPYYTCIQSGGAETEKLFSCNCGSHQVVSAVGGAMSVGEWQPPGAGTACLHWSILTLLLVVGVASCVVFTAACFCLINASPYFAY